MKVLVYGSGVIGCYLAHVLCAAGNDVTLLARGQWKEQLQQNGLRIRHHLQRKTTLDHPRVIGGIEEDDNYDVVFAVMPYNKMRAILEPLAAIHSPIVVLVGNNMSPAAMQQDILKHSVCRKQVLFGFQATAGKRDHEKGVLICERAGVGAMDIGCLHGEADAPTRSKMADLFGRTGYKLHWQPDMEAYLICHLAAVLPICYLAYACNGDLTGSTGKQRKLMRMASREAYAMLKAQGIPILPEGDDQYYAPGIKGAVMRFLYFGMAKWKTAGDLIACEHCRNAFEEMEMLDEEFEKVLARSPEFPMPNWRELKAQMPNWDAIQKQYTKESIMKLSLKEYDAMQSGWRKWINEHMEIGGFKAWGMDFTGKDILEVGCGSGYSASLIVKDQPKSYTGMDIMPEQLEKAEALGLPGTRFVQGDAADLSRFADGSFDMIVDFMILHHVEGWRRFLDEAFRVLRPGGEMYINDLTRKGVHLTDFFFRWDHAEEPLFTMKEFEQQALKSGFATVKRCNYAGLDFCFKFQKENADCSAPSGNPDQERRINPCL